MGSSPCALDRLLSFIAGTITDLLTRRLAGSPRRRPETLLSLEDAARDDEALYLARALVDLRDPRVAVVTLDRVILHVPVAA